MNRIPANRHTPAVRTQRGMSLVEIMVALVLGLVLTAGILQVFLGTRQTYRVETALSRIQETGRFALHFLTSDLRMAGHMGCNSTNRVANVVTGAEVNWYLDLARPLRGHHHDGSGTAPFPDQREGADAVTLVWADGAENRVVTQDEPATAVTLAAAHDLRPGEVAVVSDCEQTAVFQVSGPENTAGTATTLEHGADVMNLSPGNCTGGLGGTGYCVGGAGGFNSEASVFRLAAVAYYVRDVSGGQPALFRQRLGRTESASATGLSLVTEELLPGVEDLRIWYGIDDSGDGQVQRRLRAQDMSPADWPRVVSAQVHVLVAGAEDNLLDEPQQFVFDGAVMVAGDRRLRQTFSATVAVRNRVP